MDPTEAKTVALLETTDVHFAWMLGEGPPPSGELHLPSCGLGTLELLNNLRSSAARFHALRETGNWMIVVHREIVGFCHYRTPPNAEGIVEIGYVVAESRRGLGYATQAIARILDHAMTDASVRCVTAGTSPENIASQRTLEKNCFVSAGRYLDPKWGESIRWLRDLRKGLLT